MIDEVEGLESRTNRGSRAIQGDLGPGHGLTLQTSGIYILIPT